MKMKMSWSTAVMFKILFFKAYIYLKTLSIQIKYQLEAAVILKMAGVVGRTREKQLWTG
jgi:hypothetical protein